MSKETLSPEAAAILLEMFAWPSLYAILREERVELEVGGLIEAHLPQSSGPAPGAGGDCGEHVKYGITEKGACLCRAMIRVPLPVPTWVVPSLTRETDEGAEE